MSFRRITKRDKPATLEKHAKECEQILMQALSLAVKMAKRQPADVREMIASARVCSQVSDYKVAAIEYPNPKYNSTWSSNMSWNDVLTSSAEELAKYIVITAKHNLYASKHNLYTKPAKRK